MMCGLKTRLFLRVLLVVCALLTIFPASGLLNISDGAAWTYLQTVLCLCFLLMAQYKGVTSDLDFRSGAMVMALYMAHVVITDRYVTATLPLLYIEFAFFLGWLVWVLHRPLNSCRGDRLNDEDVFITFYRPRTNYETLVSLLGMPFASVGIYTNKEWLRFRKSEKGLVIIKARPPSKDYFCLNTGIKKNRRITQIIHDLEGTPARHWSSLWLRCRCVVALQPLLCELGPYWIPLPFEKIPGVYAYRRVTDERRRATTRTRVSHSRDYSRRVES